MNLSNPKASRPNLSGATMRSIVVIVALSVVACDATAQTFTATVVAVHDGDTISVRASRETIRIRLEGIDCPEYRQPYSARARRFTSEKVFRKTVTVESRGRDRYDRLLARVHIDGVELNEALVRNGLAWHYGGKSPDRVLVDAERTARAARAGLWADRNPVAPWHWRRKHPAPAR